MNTHLTQEEFITVAVVVGGVLAVGYFVNQTSEGLNDSISKIGQGVGEGAKSAGEGVGTALEIGSVFTGLGILALVLL